MRNREREAETQAEGKAGPTQGARHGTPSQDSKIRPWAEGGAKPLSHPGCPVLLFNKNKYIDLFHGKNSTFVLINHFLKIAWLPTIGPVPRRQGVDHSLPGT